MRLPDLIEQKEACAERQYDDATKGLPPGKMRCQCGKVVDEDDMHPISPDPYSMPGCGECFANHFGEDFDG